MTLAQLLDDGIVHGPSRRIEAITIDDRPRFAWRGLMLDPARHFIPVAAIRSTIDAMATLKLNRLHLHLTDDQGWRFEVKRYRRLTDIGAWRIAPTAGGTAPGAKVGGFYTQDELRALVVYAAERGVTIVPEIDLPGHVTALAAAYPEHGVMGVAPAVTTFWGIRPWLLNPRPETIAFVNDILDEVMSVFPSQYIHVGGDEAIKDQWMRSPEVQQRMKALGLADEHALQSWVIGQFSKHLNARGRRLIGWDEILEGGLPPSATVMSWRGEEGGIAAANAGHDVVMSPRPPLYFDYMQSDRDDEPPGRRAIVTLADVYRYDPIPAAITPASRPHVVGLQGAVWGEYVSATEHLQRMAFPRAAALAEVAWSPPATRDFSGFLPRVAAQLRRWRAAGVAAADSAFAVSFALPEGRNAGLRGRTVKVALSSQTGYGTIRYTLDGTTPTSRSRAYTKPFAAPRGAAVVAAPFDASGRAAAASRRFETTREALLTRSNAELAACPDEARPIRAPFDPDATGDRPAYDLNLFNGCSVFPAAPLDIVRGFRVEVARLPRYFSNGHRAVNHKRQFAVTDNGELLVRIGCGPTYPAQAGAPASMATGAPGAAPADATRPVAVANFALPDPATSPRRFVFEGTLPEGRGDADLCMQFTAEVGAPGYAVERVQLLETASTTPELEKRSKTSDRLNALNCS